MPISSNRYHLWILIGLSLANYALSDSHAEPVTTHPAPSASRCRMVSSKAKDASARAVVVLLPGGPGLSADTMLPLQSLSDQYDLCLFDPPGAGTASELKGPVSYERFLLDAEATLREIHRPLILVGHSAGGTTAADLMIRNHLEVAGIVAIDSPFSSGAIRTMHARYKALGGPKLANLERKMMTDDTPETRKAFWEAAAKLYFMEKSLPEGLKIVVEDRDNFKNSDLQFAQMFVASLAKPRMEKLNQDSRPKVAIIGVQDRLFTTGDGKTSANNPLLADAKATGATVHLVDNASHFSYVDQPDEVMKLLVGELEKMHIPAKKPAPR